MDTTTVVLGHSPAVKQNREPVPFIWQPRDAEIVRAIYKHRYLQPSDLKTLLGGGLHGLKRRCTILESNGFIRRTSVPARHIEWATKGEAIFEIAYKATRYLSQEDPEYSGTKIYSNPDTETFQKDWARVKHDLGVAKYMLLTKSACDRFGFVLNWDGYPTIKQHLLERVRRQQQIFKDITPDKRDEKNREPDAYFSIQYPHLGASQDFFLEYDRGSIDPKRMRVRFSDYFLWWQLRNEDKKNNRDRKWPYTENVIPFVNFTVLVVTQHPRYMERLQAEAAVVGINPRTREPFKSIRFTDIGSINTERPECLFGPIFYYPKKEQDQQHKPSSVIGSKVRAAVPELDSL